MEKWNLQRWWLPGEQTLWVENIIDLKLTPCSAKHTDWRNSATQHNNIVSDSFGNHIQNSDNFLSDVFSKKPKVQCLQSPPMYFNTLEFKASGECAHVRVVCVNASEPAWLDSSHHRWPWAEDDCQRKWTVKLRSLFYKGVIMRPLCQRWRKWKVTLKMVCHSWNINVNSIYRVHMPYILCPWTPSSFVTKVVSTGQVCAAFLWLPFLHLPWKLESNVSFWHVTEGDLVRLVTSVFTALLFFYILLWDSFFPPKWIKYKLSLCSLTIF